MQKVLTVAWTTLWVTKTWHIHQPLLIDKWHTPFIFPSLLFLQLLCPMQFRQKEQDLNLLWRMKKPNTLPLSLVLAKSMIILAYMMTITQTKIQSKKKTALSESIVDDWFLFPVNDMPKYNLSGVMNSTDYPKSPLELPKHFCSLNCFSSATYINFLNSLWSIHQEHLPSISKHFTHLCLIFHQVSNLSLQNSVFYGILKLSIPLASPVRKSQKIQNMEFCENYWA